MGKRPKKDLFVVYQNEFFILAESIMHHMVPLIDGLRCCIFGDEGVYLSIDDAINWLEKELEDYPNYARNKMPGREILDVIRKAKVQFDSGQVEIADEVIKSKKGLPVSSRLRFKILRRDNYRCKSCGRTSEQVELHVDHIIPRSKGGSNDEGNLQALCIDCNSGKSDLDWKLQREQCSSG